MHNRNRHHANRPTGLTLADHNRQTVALAQHDARVARDRLNAIVWRWVGRAAVVGVALLFVAIFF